MVSKASKVSKLFLLPASHTLIIENENISALVNSGWEPVLDNELGKKYERQ